MDRKFRGTNKIQRKYLNTVTIKFHFSFSSKSVNFLDTVVYKIPKGKLEIALHYKKLTDMRTYIANQKTRVIQMQHPYCTSIKGKADMYRPR